MGIEDDIKIWVRECIDETDRDPVKKAKAMEDARQRGVDYLTERIKEGIRVWRCGPDTVVALNAAHCVAILCELHGCDAEDFADEPERVADDAPITIHFPCLSGVPAWARSRAVPRDERFYITASAAEWAEHEPPSVIGSTEW